MARWLAVFEGFGSGVRFEEGEGIQLLGSANKLRRPCRYFDYDSL